MLLKVYIPQFWLLWIFFIASIFIACTDNPAIQTQPNILIIVADDLGYEKLGCYGGVNTSTPTLDKMASKGTLFSRTYTSPACTPSRMSFYTGSYVTRHKKLTVPDIAGGENVAFNFENEFITYAQLLRGAGYKTSVTGKWQLATLEFNPDHINSAGFDSWCVWHIWHNNQKTSRHWKPVLNQDGSIMQTTENDFGPDLLTNFVIKKMKEAKELNKPFLIHHNMLLPHWPIIKTPLDVIKGDSASLDNMITYLDIQVGKILDAVNELELTDNTFVFFVGDNGTDDPEPRMTRNGPVAGKKAQLNDGGMHIPFIAFAPGRIPDNIKRDDLVDFVDFFPTVCDLAGAQIPEDSNPDGISFINPLLGKGNGKREWITAGYKDDFCIFDGEWRLHHKNEILIDCRNLPEERPADLNSQEAIIAKERLLPILNELRKL